MKRIASIFTGFSLAVLFFVASAQAQFDGPKLKADIPFEFTVGKISLPAGQYEFMRTGANIYLIRDANGRSSYTVTSAPIQANGVSEKSMLKFATVDGRHLLIQIWNERADIGNEFQYAQSSAELANQPSIHGVVAGRR
jgi:hypothetical protein